MASNRVTVQVAEAATPNETVDVRSRLFERVAIEDMIATYLYELDHGGTAKLADFFTEDAAFDIRGQTLVGRKAISGYYAARSTSRWTRHVSTILHIVFDDADHAHSVYTLTYYAVDAGAKLSLVPVALADYNERLVRGSDGKWRFSYRMATPALGKAGE